MTDLLDLQFRSVAPSERVQRADPQVRADDAAAGARTVPQAKVLRALKAVPLITTTEIVRRTGLAQADVDAAILDLHERAVVRRSANGFGASVFRAAAPVASRS